MVANLSLSNLWKFDTVTVLENKIQIDHIGRMRFNAANSDTQVDSYGTKAIYRNWLHSTIHHKDTRTRKKDDNKDLWLDLVKTSQYWQWLK
jgi:hypothetical protein